jgi:hypothetical protein
MTNTYENRDFYLSSYLICEGFEMLRHQKDSRGFTTFIFEDSLLLQEYVRKYYSLKARTNPVSFSHAIKSLKTIIHEDTLLTLNTNTNNYELQNKQKELN